MAIAGIVIGLITLAFAIAYWAFVARHMGATVGSHGHSGGGYGY